MRAKKDKTKYECGYCGERFEKGADHASHVLEKHDIGFVKDRDKRLKRPVTCWRGGNHDMFPDENGEYHCECGFSLPKDWKTNWPSVPATDIRKEKP